MKPENDNTYRKIDELDGRTDVSDGWMDGWMAEQMGAVP